jgi:hypothetical protein
MWWLDSRPRSEEAAVTAPQDPYSDIMRQSQDAMRAAADMWAQAFQQVFRQPGAVPAGPEQVIDQVFDFAIKLLNAQRDFTKQLVASGAAAAETVRSGMSRGT